VRAFRVGTDEILEEVEFVDGCSTVDRAAVPEDDEMPSEMPQERSEEVYNKGGLHSGGVIAIQLETRTGPAIDAWVTW
jgi:hypothetical protein